MAAREFPARDLRVAAPYRMRHPLGEDSPQMLLVERDHEIHTLAANCANHAFAIGICLWPELLRSPLVRRVLGYVPVHEPAGC